MELLQVQTNTNKRRFHTIWEADFLKQYLNNVKQRNSTNENLSPSVVN